MYVNGAYFIHLQCTCTCTNVHTCVHVGYDMYMYSKIPLL